MAKKQKYYVVWEGNDPGVYDSWTDCQLQIKGFPNAKYKSFKNKDEALAAFAGNYADYVQAGKKAEKRSPDSPSQENKRDIIWESIAVDAACSGNPGQMEYRGVDTKLGDEIFRKKFALGTNNIGEFLAIVHALALLKKWKENKPVYSDSKIAMGWVRRKKCNTKLKHSKSTEALYLVIRRAEKWLHNNSYENPLLKWETEKWGEIPADFGRK